jgi:Glycine zipper
MQQLASLSLARMGAHSPIRYVVLSRMVLREVRLLQFVIISDQRLTANFFRALRNLFAEKLATLISTCGSGLPQYADRSEISVRGISDMNKLPTLSILLLLGFAMPATDVMAQSSAGRGAVGGAIIGGAVGGRRGAAVGAATGAVVGAHRHRHWRGHYYWRHGRCWVRTGGRSHPVSSRYCR